MALNAKYLADADTLLEAEDYSQASEKYCGAAAEAVKVVAASRGWRHSSHRELHATVRRIADETGKAELRAHFRVAESLHANFYEDFMRPQQLRTSAEHVRALINALKPMAS
jgi:hypothetical protein